MFKEEVTQYCPMCQEWAEKYDQLKVENNELKRQLKVKSNILKLTNEAKNNYKQTLTEIKEIAKNAEEQCAIPENYFKRNNVSWKQHQLKGLTCKFKQILQKCEVLKDEQRTLQRKIERNK